MKEDPMGLVKVIDEGMKLYGYRCPTCGRKVLHDAPIDVDDDLICPNCGDRMVSTMIPKKQAREPKESSGGGSGEKGTVA